MNFLSRLFALMLLIILSPIFLVLAVSYLFSKDDSPSHDIADF